MPATRKEKGLDTKFNFAPGTSWCRRDGEIIDIVAVTAAGHTGLTVRGTDGHWRRHDGRISNAVETRFDLVEPAGKSEADSGGWIEWRGGDCPVPPGTLVEFRYADGEISGPVLGDAMRWAWEFDGKGGGDIVAYRRVVEPQPKGFDIITPMLEAGQKEVKPGQQSVSSTATDEERMLFDALVMEAAQHGNFRDPGPEAVLDCIRQIIDARRAL